MIPKTFYFLEDLRSSPLVRCFPAQCPFLLPWLGPQLSYLEQPALANCCEASTLRNASEQDRLLSELVALCAPRLHFPGKTAGLSASERRALLLHSRSLPPHSFTTDLSQQKFHKTYPFFPDFKVMMAQKRRPPNMRPMHVLVVLQTSSFPSKR